MISHLRTQKNDFANNSRISDEHWYDPEFDKDIIEASFAAQYGIRLSQEQDISYAEWAKLMSGLMGDTPLGRLVSIRMERDPKIIKNFGKWEQKVRADWVKFKSSKMTKKQQTDGVEALQEALKKMFSVGG